MRPVPPQVLHGRPRRRPDPPQSGQTCSAAPGVPGGAPSPLRMPASSASARRQCSPPPRGGPPAPKAHASGWSVGRDQARPPLYPSSLARGAQDTGMRLRPVVAGPWITRPSWPTASRDKSSPRSSRPGSSPKRSPCGCTPPRPRAAARHRPGTPRPARPPARGRQPRPRPRRRQHVPGLSRDERRHAHRRLAELEARRSQPQPGVLPAWVRWAAHEEVDVLKRCTAPSRPASARKRRPLRVIKIEAAATRRMLAGEAPS